MYLNCAQLPIMIVVCYSLRKTASSTTCVPVKNETVKQEKVVIKCISPTAYFLLRF